MGLYGKLFSGLVGLALLVSILGASPIFARGFPDPGPPTPITIKGTITKYGKPAVDYGVVAWCGGLDKFGGWDDTDEQGRFEIHTTNSYDCPLGANGFIEIFDHDSRTVGFGYMYIHTDTVVNVKLDNQSTVTVPEFGTIGGALTVVASAGIFTLARRRFA